MVFSVGLHPGVIAIFQSPVVQVGCPPYVHVLSYRLLCCAVHVTSVRESLAAVSRVLGSLTGFTPLPSSSAHHHLLLTITCSPSPSADCHLLTATFCSPSPSSHRHLLLTVTFCSTSPSAHRHLLLTITLCSPSPSLCLTIDSMLSS